MGHWITSALLSESSRVVIGISFFAGIANELAGWGARFIHPGFAYAKVAFFLTLEGVILFLMLAVARALLFEQPSDYAASSAAEIEPYVKSLGFFRNKSKAVHLSMKEVVERFDGEVPQTMEELLTLRGVARKTANVVLSNAFGVQVGFVVDTHVQRLSRRLGLVEEGTSVAAIERRLMALFPRDRWGDLSHLLIFHGRGACSARKKECADHPICRGYGRTCEGRTD